jgi:hypothetical protein
MTLGACGDTAGLTSTSIYTAAMCQFPLSLVFIMHFPPMRGDFFATSSRIVTDPYSNITGIDLNNPTSLHYMHSINITPLFLLCSVVITFFVTTSVYMGKYDSPGQCIETEDYVSSNEALVTNPVVTAWNQTFIILLVISHAFLVIVVDSPTSIHFMGLIVLLLYVSLSVIIQPRIQHADSANAPSSSVYTLAVAGYAIAMCFVVSNIVYDNESFKVELVVIVAFVDVAIIIMGHTWDPIPNMQTIINCRLLYCVFLIVLNLSLYAMWAPLFMVPFVEI